MRVTEVLQGRQRDRQKVRNTGEKERRRQVRRREMGGVEKEACEL